MARGTPDHTRPSAIGQPDVEPREIAQLRRELEAAAGAFGDSDSMTTAHRARVVHNIESVVADAASAAARAGHGRQAVRLLAEAVGPGSPWPGSPWPGSPWPGSDAAWWQVLALSTEAVRTWFLPELDDDHVLTTALA
ncbi:hypothetical protein ACPEEZ_05430 [Frigoribacterium sp. 2-23]|uniref:hypothetical protein n=1 Tax=Frigoribacterium sp. 2-23 TaxID=3415006 RepID=UPI003C7010A7